MTSTGVQARLVTTRGFTIAALPNLREGRCRCGGPCNCISQEAVVDVTVVWPDGHGQTALQRDVNFHSGNPTYRFVQ